MKMKSLIANIILLLILTYSCSESTSPKEIPPLGDFLYGTYVDIHAYWSENYEGNPIRLGQSTDSTKLILNSNGDYTMWLELYIEYLDTVFNFFQNGTFATKETRYVDTSEPLTFPTWNGTIVFSPTEDPVWENKFSIPSSTLDLFFDPSLHLELSDSTGWFIVRNWYRKKRI